MGDGDALVAEYNSAGALTRRYLHGDQIDEPWVQYYGPNLNYERRFLYADHQGSIIAHSNYMGTLSNSLTYDAYGIPGSANLDRFGYTGQIWFKELGLFHYKARMYHPKLGRFLQTDPIFYADDMNMYAYVGNDPVNKIDPTGMQTETLDPTMDEILVSAPKPVENPFCWCHVDAAAQSLVNAMAEQQERNMVMLLTAAAMASSMINQNANDESGNQETPTKEPKSNVSGKEGAKDVPSWAKGERPYVGENGEKFADRLLGQKYGNGSYPKGPGSEHNKIKKWGDRSFK